MKTPEEIAKFIFEKYYKGTVEEKILAGVKAGMAEAYRHAEKIVQDRAWHMCSRLEDGAKECEL